MSNLIPFQFENSPVRVVTDDAGAPWFVAADLCKVIGLSDHKGSYKHHLEKLDDDERATIPRSAVQGTPTSNMGVVAKAFVEATGGAAWAEPEIWVVSESGAYALILRSRDATTPGTVQHRFRKWVTAEVLPALRKTGSYTARKAPSRDPSADAFKLIPTVVRAARALGLDRNAAAISANQVVTKLTGTNVMQLLGHTHVESEQQVMFFTPTELGERIGVSGRKFNMLLAEADLQAKKGKIWVPLTAAEGFCRILDTGKRHGDGTMVQQLKWAENVLTLIQQAA